MQSCRTAERSASRRLTRFDVDMALSSMRRLIFCCCCATAGVLLSQQAGAEEPVPEYELKAAFIYNFALFTDWPPDTVYEGNAVNICANLHSPLRLSLSGVAGKPVKGRRIAVRYLSSLEGLPACHILFVGGSERDQWRQTRKALDGTAILTISDDEEIGRDGVIILLAMERNRMVFDVDMRAAKQARLTLSSKLLRLARTVR